MINKLQKNNGYAILVTIVVVSIILIIATGLSRSVYKQLLLSSSAKDSQIAFYQADTASECALYFDRIESVSDDSSVDEEGNPIINTVNENLVNGYIFNCGDQDLIFSGFDNNGSYSLEPENENLIEKCFRIKVTKVTNDDGSLSTKITANGYNICDKSNTRTVERTIEVNY